MMIGTKMLSACLFTIFVSVSAKDQAQRTRPHILFVVGDDVGYNDFGYTNGERTFTPTMNELAATGIQLKAYHTFKICSPSRASIITGRYPWGAGFYDMSRDTEHCTTNFTALPQLLKPLGYRTHALGKWDVGFLNRTCSATYRGYDTFFGYYTACQGDYWYHSASGGYPDNAQCTAPDGALPTDFSSNVGTKVQPAPTSLNGTYNRVLFSNEAARLIHAHPSPTIPMFMYLAFMNVHDGCKYLKANMGKQAPLGTVTGHYNRTTLDTYKVSGAMYTELDLGITEAIDALKAQHMWNNTFYIFVSDNGGPLDHATNFPLRGGKHTFWNGGVRVTGLISGPLVPVERRGTEWHGLAHSSDWYHTVVEGMAGGNVPEDTGPRPPDGFNLWPAIALDSHSPRTEVVHQVANQYFNESCTAITVNEMKLILGNPGDNRTLRWPEESQTDIPFGRSGGVVEPGTDHARAGSFPNPPPHHLEPCAPPQGCLFNLTADPGEQNNLAHDPFYTDIVEDLTQRLAAHGASGPPNAWLWGTDVSAFQHYEGLMCERALTSGFLEPVL
eukprot:m.149543 g.149543  ORF g.149543 m.149543 type:complete len:557 (-) comp17821_c0_seq1:310-1980(-)